MKSLLCFVVAWVICTSALADTHLGIRPLDSLGEVRARFPDSQLVRMAPDWADESQVLFSFTGGTLQGQLLVLFIDGRPDYRREIADGFADDLDALKLLAAESDDQALRVKWVRWVPTTPLRVQDVVAKYGRWDAGGLSDDGFRLYRSWDARGITALLSEDEQSVLMMDFVFTEDEQREAFMRRYGQVPSWLRPGAGGGTTAAPGATPRFMPAP
ncbi:hypothetical protein [Methyloversatilis sp.]|uniref:hypothetical protein n=1 Tax=Methyloversatilis sp. TaxID=2569862 RepID=UPI0027B990EB|nr:hypothetical protein [Methyloversatilis sp.]